jgi:hypothetical protein
MKQESMLKPALISGVLLGIVSAFPVISAINCFCCAWVIGAGILAANLYVKNSPQMVTLGTGSVLGMLTGIIGAIVDTLFAIPLYLLTRGSGSGWMEQIQEAMNRVPNLPPETRQFLESVFARSSGAGMLVVILGGIASIVVFGLVGTLGGALGVALFEKRKPGQPVNPPVDIEPSNPPYEPPSAPPPPPPPAP